ncbi:MAG TPA: hypothetical protein VJ926_02775 [Patescibacteria group bacterium]|nr:hypothetical protein [Patescibacteria group bacterium]
MKAEHEKYNDISLENQDNKKIKSKRVINKVKEVLSGKIVTKLFTIIIAGIAVIILVKYLMTYVYETEGIRITAIILITFITATIAARAFKDSMVKKIIYAVSVLAVIFVFLLPEKLSSAFYDEEGTPLMWINTQNGSTYERAAYDVKVDELGDFFIDPQTGDTCRRATNHWVQVYKDKNYTPSSVHESVYVTEYDTLIDKVYSVKDANSKGFIRTHVYGYDINNVENPVIVIINLKGKDERSVVTAKVDGDQKIYASYKYPVVKHRYSEKICKNLDLSIPIDIKGDSKARVLLLNEKRVRQVLAQN